MKAKEDYKNSYKDYSLSLIEWGIMKLWRSDKYLLNLRLLLEKIQD